MGLKNWLYPTKQQDYEEKACNRMGQKPIDNSIFPWDTSSITIRVRLIFIIFSFIVCFSILSYRVIIIATTDYAKNRLYSTRNNNFRKEIVDRNGNLLAVNLPSSSLFAFSQKVVNPKQSLEKLAKILPIDVKKLSTELASNKNFVWIYRDLTPKQQEQVFNLGLPGFDFEQEQRRIYTYANLLSHIIGYVGRDGVGLAGVEREFDKFLTNSEPNASPNKTALNSPLELTIDVRLQNILNEEIDKIAKTFQAVGAVGIIADPNNGEILAMVSKPDFDPHYPSKATAAELFNIASLGTYEMGSVFKALTMAMGFDTNSITINDVYDISYMRVGKFTLKDFHPKQGWHTVPEIFLHSSNIGVSQIMLEIGKNNLEQYLRNLKLLEQLQVELPERGCPLFPSYNRWSDLSLVTMSYGYGLSITPLHFVQAIMPVVNGGYLYPLSLIKKKEHKHTAVRVFNEETSKNMRKLFRLVVSEGTGRKAEVKGYLVGGKTGTAEKLVGRRYVKNSRISSFVGAFPISNPKYIIYIMFDEPKGIKESFGFATAGWTAAPAVGKVIERMITLYGIETVDENDPEVQDIMNINYKIDNAV